MVCKDFITKLGEIVVFLPPVKRKNVFGKAFNSTETKLKMLLLSVNASLASMNNIDLNKPVV